MTQPITEIFMRVQGYCPEFLEDIMIAANENDVEFLPLESGDVAVWEAGDEIRELTR